MQWKQDGRLVNVFVKQSVNKIAAISLDYRLFLLKLFYNDVLRMGVCYVL